MIIGIDVRVLGTGRATGIEEYTRNLIAHMVATGEDVQFKLFFAGRRQLRRESWMDQPNVQVVETGMSNRMLWLRTRFIDAALPAGRQAFLDELVGGADVFFFPHFLVGATSPKCRRVMTWHDLAYLRMPELFSWRQRAWHRFQMRPQVQAASADRIITVSESTRADVLRYYGIEPSRVMTVHSGVDPSVMRPTDGDLERFRTQWGIPRRFILALGTREPRKNIGGVIAAFEQLAMERRFSDLQLCIVGPDGWLWRATEAQIRDSPVRTRIRIVGAVSDDQRPYWLSAASVLAYPSFSEGFGFPPLEAMACGTPVVAAANSSLWETVGDAGLLIDPYSVNHLAHALSVAIEDEPLRILLAERGRIRAAKFTWNRAARQTLDVIRLLV